jgi:DNA polymerase I-like protein with 3'-5' exonuclease and polymerase domains
MKPPTPLNKKESIKMKNITDQPRIVLDFETFYSDEYSLSKLNYQQYVHAPQFKVHGLAVKYPDGRTDFRPDAGLLLKELQAQYGPSFEKVAVVMHNAVFDAYVLKAIYRIVPANIIDTMLMASLLFGPEESVSLKNLAEKFNLPPKQELEFSKGKRELSITDLASMRTYAMNDVDLAGQLYERMISKVPDHELALIDHTVHLFLGDSFHIDYERLISARVALISGVSSAIEPLKRSELSKDADYADRLSKALEINGRELPMKEGTEGFIPAIAADDPQMQLLTNDADPVVQKLAKSRLLVKSEAPLLCRMDYLIGTSALTDGILPVYLEYAGTQTGRFAGGNRLNMQNLPAPGRSSFELINVAAKQIRESLCAPPGFCFVAMDASQIEARVLAWLTEAGVLMEAFAAGRDIYSEFAAGVFGEPAGKPRNDSPEEVRKGVLRHIGKTAILGLGYKMGAKRFIEQLKSSIDTSLLCSSETELSRLAVKLVKHYRSSYQRISGYWLAIDEVFRSSVQTKSIFQIQRIGIATSHTATYITLPSGRKLVYPNARILPNAPEAIKYLDDDGNDASFTPDQPPLCYGGGKKLHGGILTENIVQAIARDLLADTILEVEDAGIPVVHHIHDEIIACVPEADAERAMEIMKGAWISGPAWASGLKLDAEGKIGKNLAELK